MVALDRDESRLAPLAESIPADRLLTRAVDVADAAQVQAAVDAAVARFGTLHVAVNCAGVADAGKTVGSKGEPFPLATWDKVIAINLTGTFNVIRLAAVAMAANAPNADGERGVIVNTSSGAGLIGFPEMANYVAAKHGVLGLTKTAALENIGKNIRINAICPGTAHSRMVDEWIGGDPAAEKQVADLHPIGRIADPAEIAASVLWLCSDAASFVVGIAMPVDGGYTIP